MLEYNYTSTDFGTIIAEIGQDQDIKLDRLPEPTSSEVRKNIRDKVDSVTSEICATFQETADVYEVLSSIRSKLIEIITGPNGIQIIAIERNIEATGIKAQFPFGVLNGKIDIKLTDLNDDIKILEIAAFVAALKRFIEALKSKIQTTVENLQAYIQRNEEYLVRLKNKKAEIDKTVPGSKKHMIEEMRENIPTDIASAENDLDHARRKLRVKNRCLGSLSDILQKNPVSSVQDFFDDFIQSAQRFLESDIGRQIINEYGMQHVISDRKEVTDRFYESLHDNIVLKGDEEEARSNASKEIHRRRRRISYAVAAVMLGAAVAGGATFVPNYLETKKLEQSEARFFEILRKNLNLFVDLVFSQDGKVTHVKFTPLPKKTTETPHHGPPYNVSYLVGGKFIPPNNDTDNSVTVPIDSLPETLDNMRMEIRPRQQISNVQWPLSARSRKPITTRPLFEYSDDFQTAYPDLAASEVHLPEEGVRESMQEALDDILREDKFKISCYPENNKISILLSHPSIIWRYIFRRATAYIYPPAEPFGHPPILIETLENKDSLPSIMDMLKPEEFEIDFFESVIAKNIQNVVIVVECQMGRHRVFFNVDRDRITIKDCSR